LVQFVQRSLADQQIRCAIGKRQRCFAILVTARGLAKPQQLHRFAKPLAEPGIGRGIAAQRSKFAFPDLGAVRLRKAGRVRCQHRHAGCAELPGPRTVVAGFYPHHARVRPGRDLAAIGAHDQPDAVIFQPLQTRVCFSKRLPAAGFEGMDKQLGEGHVGLLSGRTH